jgi:hypothetical protein
MNLIHIPIIDNYFPELVSLTLPTVEKYAKKINAKINIISNRKFPDWPILYEKIQVYQDGQDADWNILMDADILIHPDTPNPLNGFILPFQIASKDAYNADTQLVLDDYFKRDGRNIGLSTCVIIAHKTCHDIWTPLDMTPEEACSKIKIDRMIVDEYCISRNLARFGLKLTAPLDPQKDYNRFLHLGTYGQDKDKILDVARDWYKKVGF